ncbi:MAG: hypothetical protein M1827_004497 [Pycnora praestabilis]|nr:MAG: hypothetical protein M1827_004497 [Pycnora praestabilis]
MSHFNNQQTLDLSLRWNQHLRQQAKSSSSWYCPQCIQLAPFSDEQQLDNHKRLVHPTSGQDRYNAGTFIESRNRVEKWPEKEEPSGIGTTKVETSSVFPSVSKPYELLKPGSKPSRRGARPVSTSAISHRGRQLPNELTRLEDLTIGAGEDYSLRDASTDAVRLSPIHGTRKRPAGAELASSDTVLASPIDYDAANPRRAKARSGTSFFDTEMEMPDPTYNRRLPQIDDTDVFRAPPNQKRTLFDPSTDATFPASHKDIAKAAAPAPTQRFYDSRAHVFRSKKEPSRRRIANATDQDLWQQDLVPTFQKQPLSSQSLDNSRSKSQQQTARNMIPNVGSFADKDPELVLQPETRPISQEQLVAEVKGIYAGLVMVEAKCIEVDNKQAAALHNADAGQQTKLNNEQFQALIALHRTLLHEHHDFFLASQHPSASPALRKLASKYAMPARMWRHGIHSFLELLRHRLPASLDHMLAFIYLAYSMMALLYETVPTFEDTWIECLGDLGRYRMAIEDDDIRDREVWTGVARFWYSKAADKSPEIGRLYHHLAILARPNILQQLFFYAKSLSVTQPFVSARESILTLFEPVMGSEQSYPRALPVDTLFIRAHAILFTGVSLDTFPEIVEQYLSLLDNHVGRVTAKWKEQGVYIAIANFASLLGFGSDDNVLLRSLGSAKQEQDLDTTVAQEHSENATQLSPQSQLPRNQRTFIHSCPLETGLPPAIGIDSGSDFKTQQDQSISASEIAFSNAQLISWVTLNLALMRIGDPNVLPHLHVSLVFVHHLISSPAALALVQQDFPWHSLSVMLNTLIASYDAYDRMQNPNFPIPVKGIGRPLPEDFTMSGIIWANTCFPSDWFSKAMVDDEERSLELPSMAADRKERILWLAYQISQACGWLEFNTDSRTFSVPAFLLHTSDSPRRDPPVPHNRIRLQRTQEDADMSGMQLTQDMLQDIENDSPEMRELRIEQSNLKSQLKFNTTDKSLEDDLPVNKAQKILKSDYTIMVCDTNLLLAQLDVFERLIDSEAWNVVVPNSVITELTGLSSNTGPVSGAAEKALSTVREAVAHGKKLRIVTARGSDITSQGFYKEQIASYESDGHKNLDDIIIQTTKSQGDRLRKAVCSTSGEPEVTHEGARAAVLVTEDRALRVKAGAYGVAAVAASMIRRLLGPEANQYSTQGVKK